MLDRLLTNLTPTKRVDILEKVEIKKDTKEIRYKTEKLNYT